MSEGEIKAQNVANRRNGAIAAAVGLLFLLGGLAAGVATRDSGGFFLMGAGVLMLIVGAYYIGKRERA